MEKQLRAIYQTFYQSFCFRKWDDASAVRGVHVMKEFLTVVVEALCYSLRPHLRQSMLNHFHLLTSVQEQHFPSH